MDLNRKLGLAAALLFVLSAATYWNDQRRAEGFQRGQKLFPNLNPDEVSQVVVRSGGETVTLARTSDGYQIQEANGYRAKNEAVNRIVRDVLGVSLARRVGGEGVAEEFGIEPLAEDGVEVALLGAGGDELVRARVGNESDDGTAHFVAQVADEGAVEDVYLSEARVRLDTSVDDFLRKEIVDVTSGSIVRIEGSDFVISKPEDGSLALEETGGREEKASEASKLKSALSRLEFDRVFLADAPEVRGLEFRQGLRVDLDDQSGYIVSVADQADVTYVQITGYLSVDRVEISQEDTDEDLEEKSGVLKRNDEINQFNAYHGSWVYALSETEAAPFALRKRDLLE